MYGFTILKGLETSLSSSNIIQFPDGVCVNNMISKFKDDKLFVETENLIIILDGIILNKNMLISSSCCKNWSDTIINLYDTYGDMFVSHLRGNFAGAILNKQKERWLIFTDQLGQKYVYYSLINNKFLCSSMIGEIYDNLRYNNIEYHLDKKAPYMLLTYGFMLENYTLCSEIKKIQPGCYITFENGIIQEKRYYQLTNEPNEDLSEDEFIEEIDRLFRNAVELQYRKDEEYGYKHICALSAGLDCRMTTFVAHDLGFVRQMNLTFSESDYYDEFIPKKMAKALKHEWLYKALDNGMWLYDIDKVTKSTGGNVIYMGVAHGDSLFRYMNFTDLGMIHSGQLGDVVISSHMKNYDERFVEGEGAYSTKYIEQLDFHSSVDYPNKEIGSWYNRYLNGANNGQQNEYHYTETFSPFTDIDFLEFCLTIPVRYRYHHSIYKKWILKKYPLAADFEWDKISAKISAPTITYKGIQIPITISPLKLFRKILVKLGIAPESAKKGMNPVALYLKENKELNDFLNTYYQYIDLIKDSQLRKILEDIRVSGNSLEKNQATSLLAAIKIYFS